MSIEKRMRNGKVLYYLAHAIRHRGKSRKLRIYLGADLSPSELSARKQEAEPRLAFRLEASRKISDPFAAALTDDELAEIKELEAKADLKIVHLSEDDWRRFTESFTYNTNAIEGSTLDEREVGEILDKNRWPDKPKEEISEAYGVSKAIAHIRATKDHLNLPLILDLHRIVFENSKPFAGRLRSRGVEVVIRGSDGSIVHRGAPSTHVKPLLLELCAWYGKNKAKYPGLVLAAVAHNQFENIHPFQDGNGRVGRLLLNNILLKHGYPPLNIELRHRKEYYAALQAHENKHDLRPTINLFLKEYRALKRMLKKK